MSDSTNAPPLDANEGKGNIKLYGADSEGGNGRATNLSREVILDMLMELQTQTRFLNVSEEAIFITLYSLVSLLGIIGNSMVWFVVIRRPHMRTATNLYILLLSASDITICLLLVPLSLVRFLSNNWPLGSFMCKLEPILTCANIYVSTICIAAMSLDRYRIIISRRAPPPPHAAARYHKRQIRHTIAVIILIIFIASILSIPVPFYAYVDNWRQCMEGLGCFDIKKTCVVHLPTWQNIFVVCLQYLLPLLILFVTYLRISIFLRQHQVPAPAALPPGQARRPSDRKSKAITLLLAITVVFFVTWLPWTLINLFIDFFPKLLDDKLYLIVNMVCHLAALSSACTNPILYGWLNNNFRTEFRVIFIWWQQTVCDRWHRFCPRHHQHHEEDISNGAPRLCEHSDSGGERGEMAYQKIENNLHGEGEVELDVEMEMIEINSPDDDDNQPLSPEDSG